MERAPVHYFGYGSLVNRLTRPPDEPCVNATLRGWTRAWNHRVQASGGPSAGPRPSCTSLSIDPADDSTTIDGVIVQAPADALAGLDAREAGYDRLSVPLADLVVDAGAARSAGVALPAHGIVFVYRSTQDNRLPADATHPILQSYVDTVMAGYLERFGEAGLAAFMSSTLGWEGGRRNDRCAPEYVRAVAPTPQQLAGFDAILDRLLTGSAPGEWKSPDS